MGRTSSSRPQFSTCCQRGYVQLALLPEPPALLIRLLDRRDRRSVEYHENICQYNMALAFTSLGVTEDCFTPSQRRLGFPNLRRTLSHGRISSSSTRRTSRFCPATSTNECNSNLCEDIMSDLQMMLPSHHRYAPQFRYASEILHDHMCQMLL